MPATGFVGTSQSCSSFLQIERVTASPLSRSAVRKLLTTRACSSLRAKVMRDWFGSKALSISEGKAPNSVSLSGTYHDIGLVFYVPRHFVQHGKALPRLVRVATEEFRCLAVAMAGVPSSSLPMYAPFHTPLVLWPFTWFRVHLPPHTCLTPAAHSTPEHAQMVSPP